MLGHSLANPAIGLQRGDLVALSDIDVDVAYVERSAEVMEQVAHERVQPLGAHRRAAVEHGAAEAAAWTSSGGAIPARAGSSSQPPAPAGSRAGGE